MRLGQRGGGLLIVVLLLITAASFAVVIAASQSGGDIKDTDNAADSAQALYLAESGVERALKRFATGTACGAALGQTITDLGTIGLGTTAYSITIGTGLTTDFSGVTALPATQCRVPVTGTVIASNVSRTIHAIVDNGTNLLGSDSNPEFSNPLGAGAPSNWTLNPATSFAINGGPDGTAPNCSRSVWHVKRQEAAAAASRAQINVPVNFTYTGGSVTAIAFHWRAIDRTGAGCAAGAASGPAWPCLAGGVFETQACFRFTGTATSTAPLFETNATVGVAVACPDVAGPSIFAPCSTSYQVPVAGFAYPLKQVLNMTMAGVGTQTATNFLLNIRLQGVGRRQIYIDRIEATNPTALGVARVQVWRDCSGAANPATCL